MLSNQQVSEFQRIYKNRFGKEISREQALEQGAKLLRLIELIYRPMTETDFEKLQARRKETGDL